MVPRGTGPADGGRAGAAVTVIRSRPALVAACTRRKTTVTTTMISVSTVEIAEPYPTWVFSKKFW